MNNLTCLLLFAATLLCGCRKDDVDLASLNYNAFDHDYAGPAIFELDQVWVSSFVSNGVTFYRLNADIIVRRDRLVNPQNGFTIRHRYPSQNWTTLSSSTVVNAPFTATLAGFVSGQSYCLDLQIGTEDNYTEHAPICFIAP